MGEGVDHVEEGDAFTYTEERGHVFTDAVDEILYDAVAHLEDFKVGIYNLLTPFDEVEGLAFDDILSPENVDEYVWKVAILEISRRDLEIVLSRSVVLETDIQVVDFCSAGFSKLDRLLDQCTTAELGCKFKDIIVCLFVRCPCNIE